MAVDHNVSGSAGIYAGVLLCASTQRPEENKESIVHLRYACRKSGEVFTLLMTREVFEHPQTQEPTLFPAIFDKR